MFQADHLSKNSFLGSNENRSQGVYFHLSICSFIHHVHTSFHRVSGTMSKFYIKVFILGLWVPCRVCLLFINSGPRVNALGWGLEIKIWDTFKKMLKLFCFFYMLTLLKT